MPTVRQLEYLVAIADLKHFRRAAELVNTTQPTLSGQLKALEERLGVVLVERSRSRVVLTPAGAEIVDVARRILRDTREIRSIGTAHNRKLSGVVRLGVPQSIGPSLVPQLAHDLRREYPDLKFFVREEAPGQLPNALADGTYDLVIGPLPFSGGEFETIQLYSEPLVLAVASDHCLARRSEVDRTDLKGLPIIMLDASHPLTVMTRHFCAGAGARILSNYSGNSIDTLREMVATGLGCAFLPALYVRTTLSSDRTIKILELKGRPLVRQVGLAWRRSGGQAKRFAEFGEFLKVTSDRVIGAL